MSEVQDTRRPQDFAVYKVGWGLYVYITPIIMIFGLVGNILSFLVMSKRATRPPATYLYLTVLAVVDILSLWVPGIRVWLLYRFDIDLMIILNCSWYIFLYYSFCNMSVYLVVSVSVDRFILTFFPMKAKIYCTMKSAIITTVLLCTFVTVINLHLPWTYVRVPTYGDNGTVVGFECIVPDEYTYWMFSISPYIELNVYSFVPVALLTTCNLLIIYKLLSQRKKLAQSQSDAARKAASKEMKGHRTMVMLVILSFLLLVTVTPVVILHIVEVYWDRSDPYQEALHLFATSVCDQLVYLNNSLNFVLYFLSAKKFREDLKTTVRCSNRITPVTGINNTQITAGPERF